MRLDLAGGGPVAREPNVRVAALPAWKRVLDLLLVWLSVPAWLPLLIMAACVVKLVSRGPVVFPQVRIGYLGRPFNCWKLRTMHLTSDCAAYREYTIGLIWAGNVPMRKADLLGDPRIIRFGKWLRASGLDEIPQLFNVVRGEMSLVGPRPCLPYEFEHYTPDQKRRCETVPGLTGWWQVNGKNSTTFGEMIALDLEYIRRQSPGFDLIILAKTVPTVASQLKEVIKRRVRRA